eukprot:1697764-Amphidinium_carterae.1
MLLDLPLTLGSVSTEALEKYPEFVLHQLVCFPFNEVVWELTLLYVAVGAQSSNFKIVGSKTASLQHVLEADIVLHLANGLGPVGAAADRHYCS